MKNKIILGIRSSLPYNNKDDLLAYLKKHGFIVCAISSKIREVAKYLLKIDDGEAIQPDLLVEIRKKGYSVNKLYWINLLLTTIPEKESNIIIEDIWEEDLYGGYVYPLANDTSHYPLMNQIPYPPSLEENDLKLWLKELMLKVV